jgi:transcriptional regulator with XRE-family HTH domain
MHGPADNDEARTLTEDVLKLAREDFGRRLRELRERRAWSQGEASRQSGISQGEWSRVERGEANPSMTTVLRMHHALEFDSVETLFGELPSRRILQTKSQRRGRAP